MSHARLSPKREAVSHQIKAPRSAQERKMPRHSENALFINENFALLQRQKRRALLFTVAPQGVRYKIRTRVFLALSHWINRHFSRTRVCIPTDVSGENPRASEVSLYTRHITYARVTNADAAIWIWNCARARIRTREVSLYGFCFSSQL